MDVMNKEDVLEFISHVDKMKNPIRQYPGKTVVYFFQDNTRTLYSFQAAALRLGCNNLMVEQPNLESFEDTVKSIQYYGHALVLRHPEPDSFTRAVSMSRIPVIQAGVHGQLTQPLIDMYTLFKELKYRGIDLNSEERAPLRITFLGYSRTVQPFLNLLNLFPKIEVHYSTETVDPNTDILYVSRRQQEESYTVNKTLLADTKPTMVIMHTLPRSSEIDTDVDTNPRSAYFHQSENGIYVRMAMLDKLLSMRTRATLYELFWIYISKIVSKFSG
jgi:aspartate carbamoyltransferase catalytic subunit